MGNAEEESSNLWWQIDIELRYSADDILRVQSVVDPFAPAERSYCQMSWMKAEFKRRFSLRL
jgi:hypothetical protein